jgi:hypothetical protein
MKIRSLTLLAAIALVIGVVATVQPASAAGGTGTCPNPSMQDADGDGIPNCMDPDYVRPLDGTGNKYGKRAAQPAGLQNGNASQRRSMFQMGDLRILAASFGFGPGTGTGVCDGTGPKGFGGFRGR